MLVLLENKIWRAQLPEGKQFVSEMEFRANIWRFTFLYKGQVDTLETSYGICGGPIKTYDRKQNKYRESTLALPIFFKKGERIQ